MHRVFIHSSHGKVWGHKDGGSHLPLPRVADKTQYTAEKFCMPQQLVVLWLKDSSRNSVIHVKGPRGVT